MVLQNENKQAFQTSKTIWKILAQGFVWQFLLCKTILCNEKSWGASRYRSHYFPAVRIGACCHYTIAFWLRIMPIDLWTFLPTQKNSIETQRYPWRFSFPLSKNVLFRSKLCKNRVSIDCFRVFHNAMMQFMNLESSNILRNILKGL